MAYFTGGKDTAQRGFKKLSSTQLTSKTDLSKTLGPREKRQMFVTNELSLPPLK